MNNKKISIPIVIVLVISIVSLGIAFATFSTTLNINGTGTVEGSAWNIVFEGLTNENSISNSSTETVLTGSASEVTHPTIKNNSTEISTYEVILKSPGDSLSYNFKIHNKGDYAARVTSVEINSGIYLTSDTSKRTSEANALANIEYKLYYTDNNQLVGSGDPKDCLSPDEEENVTLKIVFNSSDSTSVLPTEDIVLDNLGIRVIYTQESTCSTFAGGNSMITAPDEEAIITSSSSNGGISSTPPKATGNTISGAKVKVPNNGSKVTYSIEYQVNECMQIESALIPTHEQLVAANPNISSSALNNVSITLTDSNGNPVSGAQLLANETTILNLNIENTGTTLSNTITVPEVQLLFAEECSQQIEDVQYFRTYTYNKKTKLYTKEWADNLESLSSMTEDNQPPRAYIKKINDNNLYLCMKFGSSTYCFDDTTTEETITQFCNSMNAEIETDLGNDAYGARCEISTNGDTFTITADSEDESGYQEEFEGMIGIGLRGSQSANCVFWFIDDYFAPTRYTSDITCEY